MLSRRYPSLCTTPLLTTQVETIRPTLLVGWFPLSEPCCMCTNRGVPHNAPPPICLPYIGFIRRSGKGSGTISIPTKEKAPELGAKRKCLRVRKFILLRGEFCEVRKDDRGEKPPCCDYPSLHPTRKSSANNHERVECRASSASANFPGPHPHPSLRKAVHICTSRQSSVPRLCLREHVALPGWPRRPRHNNESLGKPQTSENRRKHGTTLLETLVLISGCTHCHLPEKYTII